MADKKRTPLKKHLIEKKRNRSVSIETRLSTYPHPKYYNLTVAYARNNILKKAEAVEEIIKKFFDAFPQPERDKLMSIYNAMTPEERKHPNRI